MSSTNCPSREELFGLLVGTLPEGVADLIIDHTSSCPECQAMLETCEDIEDTLVARLRAPVAPDAYAGEPQREEFLMRVKAMAGGDRAGGPAAEAAVLGELGEYQLLEKLGEGGMGTVYKARHSKLKRIVAVKVLGRRLPDEQQSAARFEREMEAVGRVSHPNVVVAYDAREIDGRPVLVMEYVAGLDLEELLRRCGPLPIREACELIRQAALGLQAAHENGLVHRDVKPSNLMLSQSGQVKLLDLGLARIRRRESAPEGEITRSGQGMGTVDYMAPEQVTDSRSVDVRADVYSLGCTLYRLLTGHAVFSGPKYQGTFEKMTAHVKEVVPPVERSRPDVESPLARLIQRMLAKNPAERFATPAEVGETLAPFAAGADLGRLLAEAQSAAPAPGISAASETPDGPAALPRTWTASCAAPDARAATPAGQETLPLMQPSGRRRRWLAVAAGLAFLATAAGLAWLAITIRIKDRSGHVVATVEVPPGGSAEIDDGQGKSVVPRLRAPEGTDVTPGTQSSASGPKARPATPVPAVAITITPESLTLAEGAPFGPLAIVTAPARITGVRSWSWETRGHRGPVHAVAYRPVGRMLATACADGAIRLWDPETSQLLGFLLGHEGQVTSLAWSPDGKYLASSSGDKTIRLWDVDARLLVRTLRGHGESVTWVAWSPDGQTLASASADKSIRLWDAASANEARVLREHEKAVKIVLWSPDGTRLASASDDRSIVLWDAASGEARQTIKTDYVAALAWSPNGKTLASALPGRPSGQQRAVTLWDAQTGKPGGQLVQENWMIGSLAWHPDGEMLVAGGADHDYLVRAYDVTTGERLYDVGASPDAGRPGMIWAGAVSCSPDGQTLAVASEAGVVQIVKARFGHVLGELPGYSGAVHRMAFSPDGKRLALGHSPAVVKIWDIGTDRIGLETGSGGSGNVTALAWSSDGQTLVLGAAPHGVGWLWNTTTGDRRNLETENQILWSAAWSPDGKMLAGGGQAAFLVDPASGRFVRRLPGLANGVAWSPDGAKLAVGEMGVALVCDPSSGRELQRIVCPTECLCSLAWSPDGKKLAAGGRDGKLFVWDGSQIVPLLRDSESDHRSAVELLRWDKEGRSLICGSATETDLWDTQSGKLLTTVPGDCADLSLDGHLIASRCEGMIRLRAFPDGQPQCSLVPLRESQCVAVSPDGHFRGSPGVQQEIICVVQADRGQEMLTPDEFAKKYHWTNQPKRVL